MKATIRKRMNVRLVAYEALSALTICAVIALGIWRAPHVFFRTIEALRDFVTSFAYFIYLPVEPTSPTFSIGMLVEFPRAWSELVAAVQLIGEQLIVRENFEAYLLFLANAAQYLIYGGTFLAIGALIFFICAKRSLKKYNHDWNKQSPPLRIFLGIRKRYYLPARSFVRGFFRHFRQRTAYRVTVIVLAIFFLNVFTVVLEFFAWYMYFIADFDFVNLGVQVIKLLWDLYLTLRTLPWWAWLLVVLKAIDLWRREIGFKRLEAYEEKFRKFIEKRSIVTLIVASMRKGKTTLLAAIQRTLEKIFRNKAKKAMREIDLKFPNFPWIVLEKSLQKAYKTHEVFSLHTVRHWVDGICALHEKYKDNPKAVQHFSKRFSRKYGVPWQSSIEVWGIVPLRRRRRKRKRRTKKILLPGMRPQARCSILFGYDTTLWPTTYNSGLGTETIYDAIHDYAQLYLIYITPSILIGNLPVRMDDDLEDRGNEIRWADDFYRKEPSPIKRSRLSHILDYDMLRLGRRKDPDGKYRNALEFGVVGITEIGKERGNQHDQKGLKVDAPESNILNDLFNQDLKMRGHCATVHYFPFIRFTSDEQRASSVNADLKELCDVVTITDNSEPTIVMPLFAIGEILQEFAENKLGKIFDEKVYNRGDQTLSLWILHNFIQKKIFDHYDRIKSVYGGYKLEVMVASGPEEFRTVEKEILFMSNRKNHANVFPTDVYQDLYDKKASRSAVGLNDVPCFKDVHPTDEELTSTHSHAYDQWKLQFVEEQLIERLKAKEEKAAKDTAKSSKTPEEPTAAENTPDAAEAPPGENNHTE